MVGERGRWLSTPSYNLTVCGYRGKQAITDLLSPSEVSLWLSCLLFYRSGSPTFCLGKCFSDRKRSSDQRTGPSSHTVAPRWRQAGRAWTLRMALAPQTFIPLVCKSWRVNKYTQYRAGPGRAHGAHLFPACIQ